MPMFRDWTWKILADFPFIFRLPPYLSHPLWHDSRMFAAQSPATGLHPAINVLLASLRTGDQRLRFRWGHGAALRVDDTIVHLALFGGDGLGQDHPPTEPRLRRRHRGWI
jgi:hypothetical protein